MAELQDLPIILRGVTITRGSSLDIQSISYLTQRELRDLAVTQRAGEERDVGSILQYVRVQSSGTQHVLLQ